MAEDREHEAHRRAAGRRGGSGRKLADGTLEVSPRAGCQRLADPLGELLQVEAARGRVLAQECDGTLAVVVCDAHFDVAHTSAPR